MIENRNKSNSFIQKFKIKLLLLFDIEEKSKRYDRESALKIIGRYNFT